MTERRLCSGGLWTVSQATEKKLRSEKVAISVPVSAHRAHRADRIGQIGKVAALRYFGGTLCVSAALKMETCGHLVECDKKA
jgi:hypothetical protein